MNLLVIAALCFALAAMLGLAVARMHFTSRQPPFGLVALHGLAAASGLATLVTGYLQATAPPSLLTASLIVFALAAVGGFALLTLHILRGAPPRFAIAGHALVAVTAFTLLLLVLFGVGDPARAPSPGKGSPSSTSEALPPALSALQLLNESRDAIAAQVALLQSENVEALRATFTEHVRSQITPELVATAKQDLVKTTTEDLVAKVEPGEVEGRKTATLTKRNGELLTTLVREGDRWLADSVWFR